MRQGFHHTGTHLLSWLPGMGIAIFCGLYGYAAGLYPGGSPADLQSKGFDWVHNYWCNLLNAEAMNGMTNPARPYAITAMLILCLSLAVFFYRFPRRYPISRKWNASIQWSGLISMFFASMVFTEWHDSMTSLSSIFALITLVGIFVGLFRHNRKKQLYSGLFCAGLLGINNYIYYSGQGLGGLALLQKITFIVVLSWILALDLETNKAPRIR